jgi:hypothetical protein
MAAQEGSAMTVLKAMLHARRKLTDPTSKLVRKSVGVMIGATLAARIKYIPGSSILGVNLCISVVVCMAARVICLFAFGSKVSSGPGTVHVIATKFTFAWSAYLLWNQLAYRFILGCTEPSVAECGHVNTLEVAVAVSAMMYLLVQACDAIVDDYNEKHDQFAAKIATLCLGTSPMVVGWSWKQFMLAADLGVEKEERFVPDAVLVATSFALIIWLFHMYSVAARTTRRRKAPEANAEYEQSVLNFEDRLTWQSSHTWDVSFLGDLLQIIDQTALQMMAWKLKGVVDAFVEEPKKEKEYGIVVLYSLSPILFYSLVQWLDKLVTTPARMAVASEKWKLGVRILRRFAEALPLGVGIGVSNVCVLIWSSVTSVIYGEGAIESMPVMQKTFHQLIYFGVIATLAVTVLIYTDVCAGAEKTYHVVTLDRKKKTDGQVFSGSFHSAYRDAAAAFHAARKAWDEEVEGAPLVGRLYNGKGKVLEEFSAAGAELKQLDDWIDAQLGGKKPPPSLPKAREGKYEPLTGASSQAQQPLPGEDAPGRGE